MKIVSVVGARPQFIKAAPLSRTLRKKHTEILVHTGQHYDENMSEVFFQELDIPAPNYHLGIGSGTHAAQTGAMLVGIEKVLLDEKPDWVLIYGDTNSTLAGALAASKLHIPVVHVEAGLRSFNRIMPEEINRVVADHLSSLLLCPSRTAEENLAAEGIREGVHVVGDVMYEALMLASMRAREKSNVFARFNIKERSYLLATVHRAENTDNPERLQAVLAAFDRLDETIIFPIHPRTRKAVESIGYKPPAHVCLIDPVGYLDMVALEGSARLILTDSGGVQKEAYWLEVPCITLRDETEWVETVQAGWNTLTGADTMKIVSAVRGWKTPANHPDLYGDRLVTKRCVDLLGKACSL
ncbi:MAG: non-hydrolyzing UDP-N-acetylglucosamine 2-epimerase [Omnitrophica WOR_2 bacterium]